MSYFTSIGDISSLPEDHCYECKAPLGKPVDGYLRRCDACKERIATDMRHAYKAAVEKAAHNSVLCTLLDRLAALMAELRPYGYSPIGDYPEAVEIDGQGVTIEDINRARKNR